MENLFGLAIRFSDYVIYYVISSLLNTLPKDATQIYNRNKTVKSVAHFSYVFDETLI